MTKHIYGTPWKTNVYKTGRLSRFTPKEDEAIMDGVIDRRSLTTIARTMGRDKTSVIYRWKTLERLAKTEPPYGLPPELKAKFEEARSIRYGNGHRFSSWTREEDEYLKSMLTLSSKDAARSFVEKFGNSRPRYCIVKRFNEFRFNGRKYEAKRWTFAEKQYVLRNMNTPLFNLYVFFNEQPGFNKRTRSQLSQFRARLKKERKPIEGK